MPRPVLPTPPCSTRDAMLLAVVIVVNLLLLVLLGRAYLLIHRLEGELGLEACRTRELEIEVRRLKDRRPV